LLWLLLWLLRQLWLPPGTLLLLLLLLLPAAVDLMLGLQLLLQLELGLGLLLQQLRRLPAAVALLLGLGLPPHVLRLLRGRCADERHHRPLLWRRLSVARLVMQLRARLRSYPDRSSHCTARGLLPHGGRSAGRWCDTLSRYRGQLPDPDPSSGSCGCIRRRVQGGTRPAVMLDLAPHSGRLASAGGRQLHHDGGRLKVQVLLVCRLLLGPQRWLQLQQLLVLLLRLLRRLLHWLLRLLRVQQWDAVRLRLLALRPRARGPRLLQHVHAAGTRPGPHDRSGPAAQVQQLRAVLQHQSARVPVGRAPAPAAPASSARLAALVLRVCDIQVVEAQVALAARAQGARRVALQDGAHGARCLGRRADALGVGGVVQPGGAPAALLGDGHGPARRVQVQHGQLGRCAGRGADEGAGGGLGGIGRGAEAPSGSMRTAASSAARGGCQLRGRAAGAEPGGSGRQMREGLHKGRRGPLAYDGPHPVVLLVQALLDLLAREGALERPANNPREEVGPALGHAPLRVRGAGDGIRLAEGAGHVVQHLLLAEVER
jgi:hypothetical protein